MYLTFCVIFWGQSPDPLGFALGPPAWVFHLADPKSSGGVVQTSHVGEGTSSSLRLRPFASPSSALFLLSHFPPLPCPSRPLISLLFPPLLLEVGPLIATRESKKHFWEYPAGRTEHGHQTVFGKFQAKNLASSSNNH